MTSGFSPDTLTHLVLWGGLLIGAALGAAAQASRFCTMGSLADWFTFGGTARLGMWLLAIAVAAVGSVAALSFGGFDATRSIPWSPRLLWLSYPLGGLIFGFGMVLASGCPQRNLVRAGAGSLKAVVVLIVAGVAAQMTLRGLFAEGRTAWLDRWELRLDRPQDLGSLLAPWLGLSAPLLRWVVLALLIAGIGVVLWRWRRDLEPGQWAAGIAIGLLVPAAWLLTGGLGYLPEHPETLEPAWLGTQSHRPEGLSFVSPLAHGLDLLTLWTDRNTTASFGITVTLGVWVGSLAAALLRREFRVEGFATARDLRDHLAGAVLMGFGGVTAMGCSIGQGLTGVAMLSTGALLALAGIVFGTRLGLWLQERRIAAEV